MSFMVRKSLKISQEVTSGQASSAAPRATPQSGGITPKGKLVQGPTARARLSCDISRVLHRRLRMAAAKNDTTIVALIETLIENGTEP